MSKILSPIVLFVYGRLWHTQKTVEALLENKESAESDLIIFSDGSKNESDIEKVNQVRNYLKKIKGFKSIQIIERDKNYGLSESIITGVTQVVNKYGKIIVVEDDLVTSPYFLQYMNTALDLYEHETEVACIHGYVYPIKTKGLTDTFFIKGADCWGWATWKSGWDLFNRNGEELLQEIYSKELSKEFDFNCTFPYTKMLEDQIKGLNDSWAIRWYASAFLKDKLTLYPKQSIVQNIGFDNSGTHSGESHNFDVDIYNKPIVLSDLELKENKKARHRFELYFAKNKFYTRNLSRLNKYWWKIKNIFR